jgi:hypothetical protein
LFQMARTKPGPRISGCQALDALQFGVAIVAMPMDKHHQRRMPPCSARAQRDTLDTSLVIPALIKHLYLILTSRR